VIEDVSTSRGIRLLSIIHNGIILGSECGFFGGVFVMEFSFLGAEMVGIYVRRRNHVTSLGEYCSLLYGDGRVNPTRGRGLSL
jgi:hypothetical protein